MTDGPLTSGLGSQGILLTKRRVGVNTSDSRSRGEPLSCCPARSTASSAFMEYFTTGGNKWSFTGRKFRFRVAGASFRRAVHIFLIALFDLVVHIYVSFFS